MKKLLYLIALLPMMVIGQTTSENYIKTTTYRGENQTNPTIAVTYFDGLGRPIEQIANAQSATGQNIVTPIVYDQYGRQVKEYLPYATQTSDLNFIPVTTALTEQANFSQYSGQVAFSEKMLEASPLNRVLKQAAPGNTWAMGNGKEIKFDYQTNAATGADAVKLYKATATWNVVTKVYDISLSQNGTTNYPANELYKTITKDENWTSGVNNTTEEFKDKEGKVILKRTYDNSIAHETYYAYDQYGNLTYVIPPLVTNVSSQLDALCYQYKYDSRNRLVEKKLPGKQWEFIVYDKLNRVAATGPALSPFTSPTGNGWMITKYDAFNRPILTAWQPSTTVTSVGRKTLQDNYNLTATIVNETKIATTTNTTLNGVAFRYTNVALPTTGYHVLSVNYYDDYNFPNAPTIPTSVEGQTVFYNATTKPKGLPTGTYVRVPETNTLYKNETSYIIYDYKARPIRNYTTNYLGGFTQVDTKYDFTKTLYTASTHRRTSTGTLVTVKDAFTYTAQDRVLAHTHQINGGTIQLLAKNDYDELGQLVSKRVGNTDVTGAAALQKVDYTYNIRGWLTGINKVDGVANPLQQGTDPLDLFGFKINYDSVQGGVAGVDPLYNGNIAETYWRTSSDNKLRKYGYQYDDLNRLVTATYQKPETSLPIPNSYRESLWYDKNGNITRLIRNGGLDSESNYIDALQIDDLDYTYNNNQLQSVLDTTGSPQGFNDGANNLAEYGYDTNGNMIRDDNKGITSIKYNHLNLPTEIIFTGTNRKINYLYNAVGKKVNKTVTVSSTAVLTTDYLDGFQYFGGVLNFFSHSEGFVKNTLVNEISIYNYVFNYTDHLGNIRLSYGLDANNVLTIIEENHYYPFGLKHTNYNSEQYNYAKMENNTVNLTKAGALDPGIDFAPFKNYDYRYNSKEFQDELGLNYYDFGARNYDPAIGRWMNIDPLAEQSRRWSPYNYAYSNPMYFVDPDGMSPYDWVRTAAGKMLYDSRVVDQTTATELYGNGATYTEVGTSYTASSGNNIVLGDYGFFKSNGEINVSPDMAEQAIQNAPTDNSGEIAAGTLMTCGVLLADDVTVVGVADDAAIPPVAVAGFGAAVAAKATYEISKIMERDQGPPGYQYALTANASGEYPVMSLGSSTPTGTMYLNAGDVWKYGETTSTGRYTDSYKAGIGAGGVTEVPQFYGNQLQIKIAEKAKIYNYYLENGHLPPGNKIFR